MAQMTVSIAQTIFIMAETSVSTVFVGISRIELPHSFLYRYLFIYLSVSRHFTSRLSGLARHLEARLLGL